MTGPEIVARGQALLGKGIRYEMGADDLTEPGLALDCSAFACRCLGFRKFDGKVWWNTDRVVSDAFGAQAKFRPVEPSEVQPGDVLVYSRKMNGGKVGHICVVVDPAKQLVIECASSAGGVIQQRRPAFFAKVRNGTAIFARYKAAS